jgi:hypothetical protein
MRLYAYLAVHRRDCIHTSYVVDFKATILLVKIINMFCFYLFFTAKLSCDLLCGVTDHRIKSA